MCFDSVGDDTILDIFMVAVVGAVDFEWVVIQVWRGGVDFRKWRLLSWTDHTNISMLFSWYSFEHVHDLGYVAVVFGGSRNEGNRAKSKTIKPDHQFI